MSLHQADWMQGAGLEALFTALGKDQARFVGGCVRDSLLGIPFNDIDVATTHKPERTIELLEAVGIKTFPTGIDHGTITAVVDTGPIEVTTLREDLQTDGRHAEVGFTDDWRKDAARRDLTMNALYLSFDGQVYDPLGSGLADAKAGRIRFAGDARTRIEEDYLRLLRYFRFAAKYGRQPLDSETLEACRELAPELDRLSGERIQAEIFKLLKNSAPLVIVELINDLGIMQAFWPEQTLDRFKAYLDKSQGFDIEPAFRLRAWLNNDPQALRKIAKRFKLSNQDKAQLLDPLADQAMSNKELIFRHGKPWSLNTLAIDQGSQARIEDLKTIEIPDFPVKGRDLIQAGMKPGPSLGEGIRMAERLWLASDCELEKNALIDLVLADQP